MVIQFRSMRGLQVSCFVALSFDALSKKISEEEKKRGGGDKNSNKLFLSQVEAKVEG